MNKKKKILITLMSILIITVALVCVIKTPRGKLYVFNGMDTVFSLFESQKDTKIAIKEGFYTIENANSSRALSLESYVGNNQNVHPKVLYIAEEFGGHCFWMAYTPYPWYINRYENPCIAFSDDGLTWTNILNNPIDDPQGNGYDSDTHLVYCEKSHTLECWYRYVSNYDTPPVIEKICRRISNDGVHWSEEEIVLENSSGDYARFLSPAILYNDSDTYCMWVISDHNGYHIEYYESDDSMQFELIKEIWLKYEYNDETKYRPWHLDVIIDDEKYIMLVMCKEVKGSGPRRWDLFLTTSDDNNDYEKPSLVVHGSEHGWDNYIYRSSIVKINDLYRIYYSALNAYGKHGIGVSESKVLNNFVGIDLEN